MRKKQDLLLELMFYSNEQHKRQQNLSSVLLNLKDKQVPEIMQYMQAIKEVETKNYWSNFYGLPFLLEEESIIWNNLRTEGIINKKATWLEIITNQRILQYSFQKHAANHVALDVLEDAVVIIKEEYHNQTVLEVMVVLSIILRVREVVDRRE
jgi:hypothetical protein